MKEYCIHVVEDVMYGYTIEAEDEEQAIEAFQEDPHATLNGPDWTDVIDNHVSRVHPKDKLC